MDMVKQTRREFLKTTGLTAAGLVVPGCTGIAQGSKKAAGYKGSASVPSYLKGYEKLYARDPHKANLEWFRNARFGLFLHWGLFSYYGENCPYIYEHNVPIPAYKKTMEKFTAEKFDADFITDLALGAEMKYVNMVTRHHDSFSLWDTRQSDFNSMSAPARRDFVAEMAEQCAKKGLGFFTYYSYGLDWVHPWFPTEESGIVRAPKRVDGYHKWKAGDDNRHYIEFVNGQIRELLSNYGPIAGMWFDPISSYYQRPDLLPVEETYALIRKLQPGCLICYKNGATGTEDFITPEVRIHSGALKWLDRGQGSEEFKRKVRANWKRMVKGLKEFNGRMEKKGWGYVRDTERIDADEALSRLAYAGEQESNMLLNTGPLFDGSIHPKAVATLREVGRRIRRDGWPTSGASVSEGVLTVE